MTVDILCDRMKTSELELLHKIFPKCPWCGSKENLELEHFIPRAKGGKTELGNIYYCCQKCNHGILGKFDIDPLQWAIQKFGYKKGYRKYRNIKDKMIRCLQEQ